MWKGSTGYEESPLCNSPSGGRNLRSRVILKEEKVLVWTNQREGGTCFVDERSIIKNGKKAQLITFDVYRKFHCYKRNDNVIMECNDVHNINGSCNVESFVKVLSRP